MQFGKLETTEVIDEDGSTVTLERNYVAGETVKPKRLHYEIRHRTDKTDLETIARIASSLVNDIAKFDASLRLERTKAGEMNGYYHVVECYTLLEY